MADDAILLGRLRAGFRAGSEAVETDGAAKISVRDFLPYWCFLAHLLRFGALGNPHGI